MLIYWVGHSSGFKLTSVWLRWRLRHFAVVADMEHERQKVIFESCPFRRGFVSPLNFFIRIRTEKFNHDSRRKNRPLQAMAEECMKRGATEAVIFYRKLIELIRWRFLFSRTGLATTTAAKSIWRGLLRESFWKRAAKEIFTGFALMTGQNF